MNKKLIAVALFGSFVAPLSVLAADAPATPEHSFSGNLTLTSDYIFRGISQTNNKPAIQGGFDYEHASGFYAGTWASSLDWVSPGYKTDNSMELDLYGGYKGTAGALSYDVGLIHYYYPGKRISGQVTPDSTEVYLGLGWEFLEVKYSHAVSNHLFAWEGGAAFDQKTRGSGYLELNASHDLADGWSVSGHVGRQKIKSYADASYTDWNIGVSKDVGFGVVSLMYKDTNAKGCGSSGEYCWGANSDVDVGKGKAVLSFTKEF
ncbi:MAG: TorF family putative porin [Rhodocyclaceae bacterium]|nr:TorF family putative porin [Rhodocyclaceae bacterium]